MKGYYLFAPYEKSCLGPGSGVEKKVRAQHRVLSSFCDCELIILGGYVGAYMGDHIRDITEKYLEDPPRLALNAEIKSCAYRIEASAAGAALSRICEYIEKV